MLAFNDFNNPQVAHLPPHLKKYIVDQQYQHYTPIDQAVWRYVMRQNFSYLRHFAYFPYIPGLKKAGLTIDKIPDLQQINDALGLIGWGAVTVDGFIPPAAFMEYQACKVLVIAAAIRQLEHIEYTAAPDIIHESAGHAPIISNPQYSQYLSYLGALGTKALSSAKDFELYECIRQLSILKESPHVEPSQLAEAEKQLLYVQQNMGAPSEMALLSRLQWWTVEYGLIGDLAAPKIYGAGLLSSIGESASCMRPEVKKIPYTIDAVNYAYDITQPQPQLFVTPNFQNLIDVLKEFENSMAFRVGGLSSLQKAMECKNVCTAQWSSGVQLSGVFSEVVADNAHQIKYVQTIGPSSLSFEGVQLDVHGKQNHPHGMGSPLGKINGIALEDYTETDLKQLHIEMRQICQLSFQNGMVVDGFLVNGIWKNNQLLLLEFTQCTVKDELGKRYFEPSQGNYFLLVGTSIVSVFNGVADKAQEAAEPHVSKENTYQFQYTPAEKAYQDLFATLRQCREQEYDVALLQEVWQSIQANFKSDWLCALEMLELVETAQGGHFLNGALRDYLRQQAIDFPEHQKLIEDGLKLIDAKMVVE